MDSDKIKDIFRKFLQSEFEEIRQNKIRFIALIFFTIIAVGFMFTDDDSEQIIVNEPEQIVQVEPEKTNTKPTKKIFAVREEPVETDKGSVSVVIGENSDDYIYIRDPFASNESTEVAEKIEIEENSVTQSQTLQIPPIPSVTPITIDNLPPIPDTNIDMLIPQDKPILPENKVSTEEFILTGTVIGEDFKNALVKKITTTSDNKNREESILVKVGDSIQGQTITDIAGSKIVLNNGENYMYLSGFADIDVITNSTVDTLSSDENLPSNLDIDENLDTTIEYQESPFEEDLPNLERVENLESVVEDSFGNNNEENIDITDKYQENLFENEPVSFSQEIIQENKLDSPDMLNFNEYVDIEEFSADIPIDDAEKAVSIQQEELP